MKPETIQSSLSALKSAGSVFGVMLTKESQVVYSDVPFAGERVEHLASVLDDVGFYFRKEKRNVDQLAFGYDGGNVVVAIDEPFRLVVLHSLHDEVDFIAKAAKSFLIDYQMGLFADEFEKVLSTDQAMDKVRPRPLEDKPEQERAAQQPHRPGTERITLQAEKGLEKAQPVRPKLNRAILSPNQPKSTLPPPKRPKAKQK